MKTRNSPENPLCYFVSDLHGKKEKYLKLFKLLRENPPQALFLGGDLLPPGIGFRGTLDFFMEDFVNAFLREGFLRLKEELGKDYPRIFLILGNDDGKFQEPAILDVAAYGLWEYIHDRRVFLGKYPVFGYANIPPSPFMLKDWERYDVSRYVDPGSVPPEEGGFTVPVSREKLAEITLAGEIEKLTEGEDLSRAIFLFHAPPYNCSLDRAALDGKMIDHAPLDLHIGSIAIRRIIEERSPWITLHGHVHESTRITGVYKERIAQTWCFQAAHEGEELSVIRFYPEIPEEGERILF